MLKNAGGLVGGALVLSPLAVPLLLHGVAGFVVGGAGLYVADTVMKQVAETVNNMVVEPEFGESAESEELDVE
jgi:hypothetical protein